MTTDGKGPLIQLNLQTVTAGEKGPQVRIDAVQDWTISHVARALEEQGCGPAEQIKLILQGAVLADELPLAELDDPSRMIAATPEVPSSSDAATETAARSSSSDQSTQCAVCLFEDDQV